MKVRLWGWIALAVLIAGAGDALAAGPSWMQGFPLKAGPNVMLMWAPVPGASSYKVYKSTDPAAPGQMIAESPMNNHMDVNVPADKSFYYTVRAVVGGKEGDPSAPGVIKGVEPLPAPKVEGTLQAEGALHVRWALVQKAAFYNLYRGDKPGGPFALVSSTQDLKYTDRNVKPGVDYYYQVSAVDATSVESPRSPTWKATFVEEKKKADEKTYTLVPKVVKRLKNLYGEKGGELMGPTDVAVGPDGRMYVTDDSRRVQAFDAEFNFVAAFGKAPTDKEADTWGIPWGIDVGPDGGIYVAYYGAPVVRAFDKEGNVVQTIPVARPDDKDLSHLSPGDKTLNPQPFDVAVGVDGTVWVTDSTFYQLIAYDKNGKEVKRVGKPRMKTQSEENFLVPTFLTVDRQTGDIFVVEAANQRVKQLDKTGKFLRVIGGPGALLGKLGIPKGIGIDAAGDVAVMDGANVRLQAFDKKTGDLKFVYTDDKKKAFEMGAYGGIAFDHKRKLVYTAEKGLRRVNVFQEQ